MVKIILFYFMLIQSFMATGAPSTFIDIDETNLKRYLGQEDVQYSDPVQLSVDDSVFGDQRSAIINVKWDSCIAIDGSSDFNITVKGVKNIKEIADSYNFYRDSPVMQTTIWLTIVDNLSGGSHSKKESYECDMLGSETWPVTFTNRVLSKLIINISIPEPKCLISVQKIIVVPPVSKKKPESSVELPVQLECENVDNIHFIPNVSLTLTSNGVGDNGHLLEDDNLILQMLYGSDVPSLEGNEWLADGNKKYPVGEMDGESRTVRPVIKATIKDNAIQEKQEINATIMMNFS